MRSEFFEGMPQGSDPLGSYFGTVPGAMRSR